MLSSQFILMDFYYFSSIGKLPVQIIGAALIIGGAMYGEIKNNLIIQTK